MIPLQIDSTAVGNVVIQDGRVVAQGAITAMKSNAGPALHSRGPVVSATSSRAKFLTPRSEMKQHRLSWTPSPQDRL